MSVASARRRACVSVAPLAAACGQGGLEALLDEPLADPLDGVGRCSRASAIRSSGQAGPPSAASALSRMRACLSLRTSALPRASSRSSSSRSARVRVTRYFLVMDPNSPVRAQPAARPAKPSYPVLPPKPAKAGSLDEKAV